MPLILFQKYNENYSRFIFNLRNKPYVRKSSINKKKINYYDHKRWISSFLKKKKNKLLIIKKKKNKMGFIRLEKNKHFYNLSWALLKSYHNRGIVSKSLKEATNSRKLKYKAIIIKNNIPSIKSALNAGFSKKKVGNKYVYMQKN